MPDERVSMQDRPTHSDLLRQRDLARSEQAARDDELLALHRAVVATLVQATDATDILAKARLRVAMWRERQLCDPLYVEQWQALLALDPDALAAAVLAPTPNGRAIRQNSPFGFLVGRLLP